MRYLMIRLWNPGGFDDEEERLRKHERRESDGGGRAP